MRRITTWLLSTISALVLLFSYHTSTGGGTGTGIVAAGTVNGTSGSAGAGGSSGTSGGAGTGTGSSDPGTSGSGSTPSATPGTPSPGSSGSSASSSGTFTGQAIETQFGPVQVEITVSGGKVTKSVVTQVPWNDRRDQEINSYAVPILNDEVVQAQSAGIDMISGATYTSDGYIQSLQSALDQANL